MTFKGFRPSSPLLAPLNADTGTPFPVPSPRAGEAQLDGQGATVS
jgi:hypothetical protein